MCQPSTAAAAAAALGDESKKQSSKKGRKVKKRLAEASAAPPRRSPAAVHPAPSDPSWSAHLEEQSQLSQPRLEDPSSGYIQIHPESSDRPSSSARIHPEHRPPVPAPPLLPPAAPPPPYRPHPSMQRSHRDDNYDRHEDGDDHLYPTTASEELMPLQLTRPPDAAAAEPPMLADTDGRFPHREPAGSSRPPPQPLLLQASETAGHEEQARPSSVGKPPPPAGRPSSREAGRGFMSNKGGRGKGRRGGDPKKYVYPTNDP